MRRIAIAVGLVLLVVGCTRAPGGSAGSPESTGSPVAIESPEPTAALTPSPRQPSAAASVEPLPSDPELRHTVELRRDVGLRSDLEWIAAVAADPRASTYLLAIPLLPEEEADFTERSDEAQAVGAVVTEYASAHSDEFGGMYVDHASRAGVVTLWTGHLADHDAALRARLETGWRIQFEAVRFSEIYLRGLQDQITADLDWMAAIPAMWQGVGDDVIHNRVLLTVSSSNPDAEDLIKEHFDLGDALAVQSDGTGVALIPWGEVVGRVRTTGGHVAEDHPYELRWHSSGPGQCGGGDVGYGVSTETGGFTLPCQEGTWTIEVVLPTADGERTVGKGTVDVPANGSARLDIVLAAPS